MTVLDVISIDMGFVLLYLFLGYGIFDLLTVLIYRQILKCILPFSICIWRHGLLIDRLAIRKKVYLDVLWSQPILVISIVPCLHTTDACLLRCCRFQLICNRQRISIVVDVLIVIWFILDCEIVLFIAYFISGRCCNLLHIIQSIRVQIPTST